MAYRRKQGLSRSSTFQEDLRHPPAPHDPNPLRACYSFSPSSSSLAAQAIRASAFRRPSPDSSFPSDHLPFKELGACGDDLGLGEAKSGFWGVLALKAKSILDDDMMSPRPDSRTSHPLDGPQLKQSYQPPDNFTKMDNPAIWRGLGAITSSFNHLGGTFEEGRTIVESKTADLSQIKVKGSDGEISNEAITGARNITKPQSAHAPTPTNLHETQLKASRDVAMATAAKAKLLLRELKTVKADLAFAKARCAQLEEENKLLRDKEGRDKGQNRADDDLIRLQLETLLAEKARLASENEVYSRENRFLREIVEYHQLTMQDVVYLDEGREEESEFYPMDSDGITSMLSLPSSPTELPPPSPHAHNKTTISSVSQHVDDLAD